MYGPVPFRILYVCVTNTCRSVLAERLTRRDLPVAACHVGSAGTQARPGRPMHPYVRDLLHHRHAPVGDFASRRLTPALVASSHLVLTASAAERDAAVAMVPAALGRIFTLREFGRLVGYAQAGAVAAGAVTVGAQAVEAAHQLRRRLGYAEPGVDDITAPKGTVAAFQECAHAVEAALRPAVAALAEDRLALRRPG